MGIRRAFVSAFRRLMPRTRTMPLGFWLRMRSMFNLFGATKDVLLVYERSNVVAGDSICFLEKNVFEETDVFGLWALDVETLKYLEGRIKREKPQVIIECGAGLSTLWLAQYAAQMSSMGLPVSVVSLEQSAEEVEKIRQRLRRMGLEKSVSILHAPLDGDFNYQFNMDQVLEATRNRKADWLLIDGPAGPPGCRRSTLPALLGCAKDGVRWYLDDAFRDAELAILEQWSQIQGVDVEGILPVPKGLATGTAKVSGPIA